MNPEPFHIVLADDDEDDRLLFTEAFAELKINTVVHTANDGIELMEWLGMQTHPLPHLLFLDLNMPHKNGLECLKEIRRTEKLKEIFVAIFSTSDNEKHVLETFRNGANIYITKPNNFTLLKQVLEKAVLTAYQHKDQPVKRENFLLRI